MIRFAGATCVALLLTGHALAADFYVGARLGVSKFDGVADTDGPFVPVSEIPDELPIGGLPFDSTETAWSVHVGWQARDWLALEFGYTDLGDSGFDPGFAVPAVPVPVELTLPPTFVSNPTLTPVGDTFVGSTLGGFPRAVSLAVEQWHVGARFSAPLYRQLSAHWYLGIARTSFDVSGSAVFFGFDIGPPPTTTQTVRPNAEPGSETGLVWGFGFDWAISERFVADLAWRRHETDVLDIDALTLGVGFRL